MHSRSIHEKAANYSDEEQRRKDSSDDRDTQHMEKASNFYDCGSISWTASHNIRNDTELTSQGRSDAHIASFTWSSTPVSCQCHVRSFVLINDNTTYK